MDTKYFLNNKYTKIYYKIIERALNRENISGYFEKHHIIPKCFENNKETVKLTAKEHYICHLLLIKMCKYKKHKKSMIYALMRFRQTNSKNVKRITGSAYNILRQNNIFYGKNNPFFGKGYLMSGEKNHFYGKKHSEETKKLLSQQKQNSKRKSGPYKLISPEGQVFIIKEGIYSFCREHNLVPSNIISAAKKNNKSKGWSVSIHDENN